MDKKLKILLVDNEEKNFDEMRELITSVLDNKNIPYEFIFTFEENMKLIQLLIHVEKTGSNAEIYKSTFQEMLNKISRANLICVIDCNLGYDDVDHLGIDLINKYLVKEKKIHRTNIILASIFSRKELRDEPNGLHFVHKSKNSELEIEEYHQSLKDEVNAAKNVIDFFKKTRDRKDMRITKEGEKKTLKTPI